MESLKADLCHFVNSHFIHTSVTWSCKMMESNLSLDASFFITSFHLCRCNISLPALCLLSRDIFLEGNAHWPTPSYIFKLKLLVKNYKVDEQKAGKTILNKKNKNNYNSHKSQEWITTFRVNTIFSTSMSNC